MYPFVVACRNAHIEVCEVLLRAHNLAALKLASGEDMRRLSDGSHTSAAAQAVSRNGDAPHICYICEQRVPTSMPMFFQHIYLCLIQQRLLQEYMEVQKELTHCANIIVRASKKSRRYRTAAKA